MAVAALAVAALAGCGSSGDLSVVNEGASDVTVSIGDEDVEVSASGGALLLDTGCADGDVTVTFPSGSVVTLDGPVCPDQEIVVHDDERVELRPA
jgi:hypothetical protein